MSPVQNLSLFPHRVACRTNPTLDPIRCFSTVSQTSRFHVIEPEFHSAPLPRKPAPSLPLSPNILLSLSSFYGICDQRLRADFISPRIISFHAPSRSPRAADGDGGRLGLPSRSRCARCRRRCWSIGATVQRDPRSGAERIRDPAVLDGPSSCAGCLDLHHYPADCGSRRGADGQSTCCASSPLTSPAAPLRTC